MSTTSKAFKMFSESKSKVQVAIALNLEAHEVVTLSRDYLLLLNLERLMQIYHSLGDNKFEKFYSLFILMEEVGLLSKTAMARQGEQGRRLDRLDEECLNVCGQIGRLNTKKVELEKKVEELTDFAILLANNNLGQGERRKEAISNELELDIE